MIRGLATAIRLLTMIPIPGREAERLSDALYWFPAVGLLLGGLLWATGQLVGLAAPTWSMGAGGVIIVVGAVLTLFLHLDGLADWADAFTGAKDRTQTLRIMKDPCVGAFGAIALILVLLMKWICVTRLIEIHALHWLLSACVVSRALQVDLATALPYARAAGGTGRPFVEGAHGGHRAVALVTGLGMVLLVSGPAGGVILTLAWLAGRALAVWFRRRVGGVTGDVLGAASELIETGVLFAGAVLGNSLCHWNAGTG
jgi:adenosylcobinamide-GDP ribazoletransferase